MGGWGWAGLWQPASYVRAVVDAAGLLPYLCQRPPVPRFVDQAREASARAVNGLCARACRRRPSLLSCHVRARRRASVTCEAVMWRRCPITSGRSRGTETKDKSRPVIVAPCGWNRGGTTNHRRHSAALAPLPAWLCSGWVDESNGLTLVQTHSLPSTSYSYSTITNTSSWAGGWASASPVMSLAHGPRPVP